MLRRRTTPQDPLERASPGRVDAVFGGARAAFVAAFLALASIAALPGTAAAFEPVDRMRGSDVIPVTSLPREGREVLAAIRAGGPFVSHRDGQTFGNREGMLPKRRRGYYAEYTVPTPGASDRGARRIVAGRGETGDARTTDEFYYTSDHYRTFRRIVQ